MNDLVSAWLGRFTAALADPKQQAFEELFTEECYWRDLVAFTWNITTVEGCAAIFDMATVIKAGQRSKNWALKEDAADDGEGHVEAWLTFETDACNCLGHVRLSPDGRCFTLTTLAEEIKGHGDPSGPKRVEGRGYGAMRGREPHGLKRKREKADLGASDENQPFVVIVGGGQCGLAIGARLKRLGVPSIILDKHPRIGDCWRKRYDALYLHDPVFANHLPHMKLPDDWPLWLHKDQMADWLEVYVKAMDLNYWANSACTSASWDEDRKEWIVNVECYGQSPSASFDDRHQQCAMNHHRQKVTLKPKHLILATGLYGRPQMPELEGREHFQGPVFHSSQYKNGRDLVGKHVVVVGSNTSAHDISEDLWESGVHVTMVQRSPTMIIHINTQLQIFGLYDDAAVAKGITTEQGDLKMVTSPFKLVTEAHKKRCKQIREQDADYYRKLEQAGFRLDFGEDESANVMMFLRRGSGYYFDTGASELIINGDVKLQHGDVRGFTSSGKLLLSDGTELAADAVVLATGYRPLNDTVEQFLGKEVSAKLGRIWGLGSSTRGDPGPWEGELRNMWKPTAVEGLWVQGGNLSFSRIMSKYLALQLQARYLGLPTPTYGVPAADGSASAARGGC